jgi:tape measure domain-containing protein
MQATDLKVRVGFLFDEKSLNALSKRLQKSGEQLSRIGTDLTLSLSAPLAAFGAASIKAAGDIESLTLALKSQLGSSEAAAAELDKLTEAAKNPGLGVEQAVRGSVRLQGVGLAADEARETLIQMGNAIAATGGTAQELDNVTRQFAQMISKGRVLQEDVSILSENMPGLAQLMQKAFGTQSVEAIREMGVGGKEFVQRITEAAKELPRVEGGIKNGIGNAMDALKQSAAKVGFAINNAFNVTKLIEDVTQGILNLVNGFASLSSGTQKAILAFGGLLIAAGPVVKVFGAVKELSSFVVGAWGGLVTASKALITWLGNVRTAFIALNAATQAFILIGIGIALYQAADAMGLFAKQLTNTEKAQQAVNNVVGEATASVEQERVKVGALVGVINDNTKSLEEKKAALNQLKQISPKYFGDLDIEKGKVIDVTGAMNAYIDSLVRANIVKNATEEIAKLKTELNGVKEAADPTLIQQFGNNLLALATGGIFASKVAENLNANTKAFNEIDLREGINQKIASLEDLVKKNLDLTESTKVVASTVKDFTDKTQGASEKAKVLKDVLSDIQAESDRQSLLGINDLPDKLQVAEAGLKKLLDVGWKPNTEEVKRVAAEVVNLQAQINALTPPAPITIDIIRRESTSGGFVPTARPEGEFEAIKNQQDAIAQRQKDLAKSWRDTYIGAAQEVSGALFNILGGSLNARTQAEIDAAEQSAAAAIQAAEGNSEKQAQIRAALDQKIAQIEKKAGKRRKAQAIAEAIVNTAVGVTRAISSAPPPLNIPAIVAASVAGAAQIAIIAATPFARGTGYAPGGLSLVGEQGPELINLPRGSQVYSNPKTNRMLDSMGGGGMLSGEFTVRGTDLVLVLERAQNKNQRFR